MPVIDAPKGSEVFDYEAKTTARLACRFVAHTQARSRDDAARYRHEALAVVLRVTEPALSVLCWERLRKPYAGAWALPSGAVEPAETLGACVARQLATKVDVAEIAHLEQLETRSAPDRDPSQRTIATAYLGVLPITANPRLPERAGWLDTATLPPMAFDHASVIGSAVDRLRSKLSYSNLGFALAPAEFTIAQLRDIYSTALGRDISATNLQRVLQRRGQLEPAGRTAHSTSAGGRPAALFQFSHRQLEITDPFAVLRPSHGSQ
jgi:ADP-ribose pyrophosphatase YjhB (NUDIX family)